VRDVARAGVADGDDDGRPVGCGRVGGERARTNLLLGFDADRVRASFDGGGVTMTTVLRWTSPIIAKGRFFVGATGKMYAFNAP